MAQERWNPGGTHPEPEDWDPPGAGGLGWGASLGVGLALLLLLMGLLGCQRPLPSCLHLYDVSGTRLLRCDSAQGQGGGRQQGGLRCRDTDGEVFQGEWMTLARSGVQAASGSWASLPPITGDPLVSRWNWAAGFGVDLEGTSGKYGVFLLYGNKGTVIDGIFLFPGKNPGILGAATDNKGHRYKVMG